MSAPPPPPPGAAPDGSAPPGVPLAPVPPGRALSVGSVTGLEAIFAFNQPVFRSWTAIQQAAARLGPRFAKLFATPHVTADGQLAWYSDVAGTVRRFTDLPPAERAQVDPARMNLGEVLRQHIHELGRAGLNTQAGNTAALLQAAQEMPSLGHLYIVGDQPVMTFWGFRNGGAVGVSPFQALPAAAVPAVGEIVRRGWLLPLLLLLGLGTAGGLGYWGYLERERIAGWFKDEEAPVLADLPAFAALELGPLDPLAPLAPSALTPLDVAMLEEVQSVAGEVPILTAELDRLAPIPLPDPLPSLGEVARLEEPPPPSPPPPPPPPVVPPPPLVGQKLELPPSFDNLDFLEGLWRSKTELFYGNGRNDQPVEIYYKMGKGGTGQFFMRLPDGTYCVAPAQARATDSRTLAFTTPRPPRCPNGSPIQPIDVVCKRLPGGEADCDGLNVRTRLPFETVMERAARLP